VVEAATSAKVRLKPDPTCHVSLYVRSTFRRTYLRPPIHNWLDNAGAPASVRVMATPEEIGKRWVDAFNKKDIKALMALYAENAVNAQPHLPAPITGKKAIEEDLNGFLTAFPDAMMKAKQVVTQGNSMAMEWAFTGTHTGPLAGPTGTIPPTKKTVHVTGAEFLTHDAQGLIVNERGYFDLVSFMTQLGVMPPRGS
jgi:steroid delta-isomerase-like uncharacterized protein